MIDLRRDEVIPLNEAPKHLPPHYGKRIHIATLYRWAKKGAGGTRLETIQIGGRLYTSLEALQAFASARDAPSGAMHTAPPPREPGDAPISPERAARYLDEQGLDSAGADDDA